ncbi:MAG: hypothetical protein AAGA30_04055, partial [Planctomycetota bacterium]
SPNDRTTFISTFFSIHWNRWIHVFARSKQEVCEVIETIINRVHHFPDEYPNVTIRGQFCENFYL